MLEILGVDIEKFRPIEQPTQFDKIILPDRSFLHVEKGFTKEYQETIDCLRNFALKHRTPTSSKKIYYFHGARQTGEERLAQYFKAKGYEIIQPEKLTLDEQLNILINCESFASTIGSCAHNSAFLRDNSEVILINRMNNGFYDFQRIIDQVHSQNISYIDSSLSIFYKRNGPFCYIISDQLRKFFGDEFDDYEESNLRTFLEYTKNSVSRGLAVDQGSLSYYKPILQEFKTQLNRHEELIASYNIPFDFKNMRSLIAYQTHVHTKGWGAWLAEGKVSDDIEKQLDIQAIKINFPGRKVYYSVYWNDKEGWSEEVSNSEIAGTTGKSKSIFGVRIRLDEAGAKDFDILYRVHKYDGQWTNWAKNGETIYSHGQKLNAIQIKLESKKS